MIDSWWEPTGPQPNHEGDEAGGDDVDVKGDLPRSSARFGLPDVGSGLVSLIPTTSAEANAKDVSVSAAAEAVLSTFCFQILPLSSSSDRRNEEET